MKTKTLISLILFFLVILFTGFKDEKIKIKGAVLNYSYIPQGSCSISDSTFSLDFFWISQTEVTNSSYDLFLSDLKRQGNDEDLKIASIQNDRWAKLLKYNGKAYAEYYHSHKSYAEYPVVNVSYEGALLYCKWLTSKLEDKSWEYRLPTKKEWIYAAKGGLEHSQYAWGGTFLRGRKGELLCNFRLIGDEKIHQGTNEYQIIDEINGEKGSTTEPSKSHEPNSWGLYNVCGNVAEMVNEKGIAMGGDWNSTGYDVRITSEQSYNEPSPMIGFRPVLVRKK